MASKLLHVQGGGREKEERYMTEDDRTNGTRGKEWKAKEDDMSALFLLSLASSSLSHHEGRNTREGSEGHVWIEKRGRRKMEMVERSIKGDTGEKGRKVMKDVKRRGGEVKEGGRGIENKEITMKTFEVLNSFTSIFRLIVVKYYNIITKYRKRF